MKITVNQLRKIIKEEVNNELFLKESTQSAQEVLSDALRDFANAYLDSGLTVEDVCEAIMNEAQGMCDLIKEEDNQEMTESEEKDVTGDGKEDFTDVMASRMMASGLPKKKAIAKAEKTTKNIRDKK
jgi:hypothetical protein